ncbi:polyketide synthase dehydratase domain-containing protein, partial [Streptomyces sp. ZYX-F-203]
LVTARSSLMQELPVGGAMVAVQASEAEVLPHLTEKVSIAAVNGPASVVIAGDEAEVLEIASRWESKRLRVSHAFHSPLMDPMLDDFREILNGVTFHAPQIPFTTSGDVTDPEYWVNHVRDAVRFHDNVRSVGDVTFLEIGPDGVLSAMAAQDAPEAVSIPVLRKDKPEPTAALTALATLHVHGTPVDWTSFYPGGTRVDLPTYAFQRQRYWPAPASPKHDATGLGLVGMEHPLLGAAVELAEDEGVVFTSRLSTSTHPWLAEHEIMGHRLVPAAVLVELALRAGDEVGCGRVDDLTLVTPLALPDRGGVQVRLRVAAEDAAGRRTFTVHARPEAHVEEPWTQHASGVLATGERPPGDFDCTVWPPAGAVAMDHEDCYDRFADAGFAYGPTFQGLRAAWRLGEEVYAELALPNDAAPGGYGLHPALLDAALHAALLDETAEAGLPFSWAGVSLHATGASRLRLRMTRDASGTTRTLAFADPTGTPVASIDSLVVRPVAADRLGAPNIGRDALFGVEWVPLGTEGAVPAGSVAVLGDDPFGLDFETVASPGDTEAGVVLLPVGGEGDGDGDGDVVGAAHTATVRVLAALQEWIAAGRPGRLVVVTRDATVGGDLVGAAVWGLVRSAQSEHPGSFGLIDLVGAAYDEARTATGADLIAAALA